MAFHYGDVSGPQGQEVCLVSIPEFATTFQVCLLNLKNLECYPVLFKSWFLDDIWCIVSKVLFLLDNKVYIYDYIWFLFYVKKICWIEVRKLHLQFYKYTFSEHLSEPLHKTQVKIAAQSQ